MRNSTATLADLGESDTSTENSEEENFQTSHLERRFSDIANQVDLSLLEHADSDSGDQEADARLGLSGPLHHLAPGVPSGPGEEGEALVFFQEEDTLDSTLLEGDPGDNFIYYISPGIFDTELEEVVINMADTETVLRNNCDTTLKTLRTYKDKSITRILSRPLGNLLKQYQTAQQNLSQENISADRCH